MNTSETADQVLARASALEENEKYDESLRLLSDSLLEKLADPRLYKLKAMLCSSRRAFRRRTTRSSYGSNVDLAIKFLTKAIGLDPKDPSLYLERSRLYRGGGRGFDKANADINSAIALDPKAPQFYLSRGMLFYRRNRKLAEQDFAKAMALGRKRPDLIFELGHFLGYRKQSAKAVALYEKGLRIEKSLHLRVTGRAASSVGSYYLRVKKNYKMAYKYFSMAVDSGFELNLEREFFVFVYKSLSMIPYPKRWAIYKKCVPFIKIVEDIRGELDMSYYGDPIVHFTKLSVADILFSSDQNKFRFYHTANLNDPEEGKTILEVFNSDAITEAFASAEMVNESNFYIGSFLPEDHADDLVMWRTYGKDEEGSEAKGCSIVFDSNFFEHDDRAGSKFDRDGKANGSSEQSTSSDKQKRSKRPEQRSRYDTTLYKVIYFNRLTRKYAAAKADHQDELLRLRRAVNKLRKHLLEIIKLKDAASSKAAYNLAIDGIVYFVINEVRYFFKSADYSYENEQRVVMPLPPGSPLVKIEETGKLPKRLYVESNISMRKYITKIVLGPRVIQPERWTYLKAKMIKAKYSIDMVKSKCKFQ